MNTHADKTQDNKRQSISAASSQVQSGSDSTFQFVDNRPEAVVQRILQEMANNSPQAKQAAQLQEMTNNYSAQQQNPIQKKENNTGLPDNLKSGIENLSGYSMDDVKVHYNSGKPAQLQAHAYAQGTDIHLDSGQEKHLPHEAWHVVQQKQGRVKPTMQMKGKVNVNNDAGLEKEADLMGAKALFESSFTSNQKLNNEITSSYSESPTTVQMKPTLAKVVWGVTHAVKEVDGSILGEGGYEESEIGPWGELVQNEVVKVDDEDLFISRRGANQEIEANRESDRTRQPNVEWIRALKIKGIDVKALNVYIRSETIHIGEDVVDPEAGWSKVTVKDVVWDDDVMLQGVKKIGDEYAEVTEGRTHDKGRNICSTDSMDQDDEGLDVARDFADNPPYRDISTYGDNARTKFAESQGSSLIGVMQITVEGKDSDRYLYIKWLLGSRSSRGAGVALVRSALEHAIQKSIMKVKVESAKSAVDWYEKRGFSKVGNAQHMNDMNEEETWDDVHIDCGCAEMELQFYWGKK
ncbi:GNAT family N-acetyltransferase [Aquimarina aggregata]|uniref:GNAT family N-acetyltransferase n=1 Tax=Aquimarina aggregata TaxID=1642818 RepID=UPI00082B2D8B|nr:GNAT family N-acetyltransferase [Aquimarina aggregata]